MACPACDGNLVAFGVPAALREHAPDDASTAAICVDCLRTFPVDDGDAALDDPDFDAVHPAVPDGEAGVALALVCGKLESLALNRAAIEELLAYAEAHGADIHLFFDRLEAPDAAFDVARRRDELLDLR